MSTLKPIDHPAAWRGDAMIQKTDWIHQLSERELGELERAGAAFLAADPDLRQVTADQFPVPETADSLARWGEDMDRGRGFVLVRGLRSHLYSDALSASIFFLLGLHLGEPMRQNELGDAFDHVIATTSLTTADPKALGSRTTDRLNFHSDSSDVVALMCLRGAKAGGSSILMSAITIYNEVLARRPDLAPLLFEPWHNDWRKQDPDAPANTYVTPMMSIVDGVFSAYIGTRVIRMAQDYPEVPRLTPAQVELLDLIDAICAEPDMPLHMDFQPGDMQWLLNYAALHSRTAFKDHPEPSRRRHLRRLWLTSRHARPITPKFGRYLTKGRGEARGAEVPGEIAKFHITEAVVPRLDWGL